MVCMAELIWSGRYLKVEVVGGVGGVEGGGR